MESPVSLGSSFLAILMLVLLCNLADCYDPLDPNGNITVTFDVMTWTDDGYEATVTIQNYYQYRHVEKPGWKMEWTWSKNEVIWYMEGALATQQGNCSNFKFKIPHSCMKSPVIVDLLPDALPINRFTNCCRGGVLAAWAVDPSTSFSAFNITVGNLGNITENMPQDLKLMAPGPGYTCSTFEDLKPTIFPASDIRRKTQALNSAALFWGLKYFNDMLLRADGRQVGSVTSEILLRKDDKFTLRNGWAFPRRIYFNGENCEMPLPDIYPSLSA